VAFYSADGGATWSAPFAMPHLPANTSNQCSDPVLAYAPDGSRVYYSYMDIKQSVVFPLFTQDLDIVVSYSDDDGETWTGPIVALDGSPSVIDVSTGVPILLGFDYDKNWVGTHVTVGGKQGNNNWVYVTATRFDNFAPGNCTITFTRSNDKGLTWDTPTLLDGSAGGCGNPVVQGSRPHGGVGSDVLVAWYNSSSDGWLNGGFEIRTAHSSNNGASFSFVETAAADSYEAPFWLGPFAFYKRWWGTMFPDVEITPGGDAHIIYGHDPNRGSADTEDGDIRHVMSPGPPYDVWSAPVTVNDDGMVRTQGYAALEVQHGGRSSTLHAIWEDTRTSPEFDIVGFPDNESSNLFWDIFYSRKVPGKGAGWFRNFRVTEASSLQDWIFTGDYNDLAANNRGLFAIFVDRRDKSLPSCFPPAGCGPPTGIFDFEDDVFGSLIIAGGGRGKVASP
jgi:hypothetical protein